MPDKKIQKLQSLLGVDADGIWGPISQGALNRQIAQTKAGPNAVLASLQKVLGVAEDGLWGPVSQGALNAVLGGGAGAGASSEFKAKASSFADPADVVAFKKCKAQGKSDLACFKVGDNGVGQFGAITAQTHTPMVALHRDDMVARWGSVNAAAHRRVRVTVKGVSVEASVEDRMSSPGRIDLNPACAKVLGLNPPFLVACTWTWV